MSDDAKLAKEGLAFVRREKQDDALITDRLKSVYGEKKRTHDTNRRGPKWVCAKCKYMNFESRRVCGECLAVQEDTTPAGKKKGGDGGSSVPALPAHTEAPDAKIMVVGGRSYRVHAGPAFKKKNRGEGKSSCKKGDAKKGGDCSDDDGSCSDDDGSCDEDGAACGAASAGSADGELPDSDDDGSEPFYSSPGVSVLKDGSQYACNYYVSPSMFSHLIGPKGKTLRETHWKSGAEIELPPSGASPTATIEIRGRKRMFVRKAIQEIQAILAANTVASGDGAAAGNITHFISVPLGRIPALKAAFSEVLDTIDADAQVRAASAAAVAASTAEGSSGAASSSSSAVGADLFQIPSWVHYSIVMLCLPTEAALNKAREILKAVVPELSAKIYTSSATPKSVALKGVVSLSGSPSKAHVLYAQPDPSHPSTAPLIQMCEGIKAAFAAEGMVPKKDVDTPLTLHATLLNATFRMAKSKQRRRQMFDGSWVVDKFGKFDFGVHDMPPFEINRKGEKTKDTTMDSFPVCLGAVSA